MIMYHDLTKGQDLRIPDMYIIYTLYESMNDYMTAKKNLRSYIVLRLA